MSRPIDPRKPPGGLPKRTPGASRNVPDVYDAAAKIRRRDNDPHGTQYHGTASTPINGGGGGGGGGNKGGFCGLMLIALGTLATTLVNGVVGVTEVVIKSIS